jgi:hypothetical protein
MARYFFSLRHRPGPGGLAEDHEGDELTDVNAAREHALSEARNLIAQGAVRGPRLDGLLLRGHGRAGRARADGSVQRHGFGKGCLGLSATCLYGHFTALLPKSRPSLIHPTPSSGSVSSSAWKRTFRASATGRERARR